MVILDTPPLLGLSDTRILASKVDGIVAVVDISRANKKSLKYFKALLAQTGTHVLGCVVNKQRRSRKDTSYSYYYSYYYRNVEPKREEKHASNGHAPSVPVTLSAPAIQSQVEEGENPSEESGDDHDRTIRLTPMPPASPAPTEEKTRSS